MNKSRCISTIKHGEILQLAIFWFSGGGGGKGSNMFSSLKSDAVVPETLKAQKPIRFPGFLLLPKIWMMMLKKNQLARRKLDPKKTCSSNCPCAKLEKWKII